MRKATLITIVICGAILLNFISTPSTEAKFINTFLIKIGGSNFTNSESTAKYLSRYDMIITRKMESDDIGGYPGSTWKAIKAYNPDIVIHLYTCATHTDPKQDSYQTVYTDNLARYTVDRGHSNGKLKDHNGYFLHNNGSIYVYKNGEYQLDPGDKQFQAYSLESLIEDFPDQPWAADGVYTDMFFPHLKLYTNCCGKIDEYATQGAWSSAILDFIDHLSKGLSDRRQTFSLNHGNTRFSEVKTHWKAANELSNPPAYLLEEGAFAVLYGKGVVQFFPESQWKNQIDTMASLTNISYLAASSTDLSTGDASGNDYYGVPVTGWDTLYFALGSFCLGKDDDDLFFFRFEGINYQKWTHYQNEYDKLNLGPPIRPYQITTVGGANIYYREFANGYVYVNPTQTNVTGIRLPVTCKRRTHATLQTDLNQLANINTLDLNAHRAAFLYKSGQSPRPALPPSNVQIKK